MISLGQALTIAFVQYLLATAGAFWSHNFWTRPITVCPLYGLLLGDLQAGLTLGASLEAIFMGITSIGGTTPSDVFLTSVIVTSFNILAGVPLEDCMILAVGIGIVTAMISQMIRLFITSAAVQIWDNYAAKGNRRAYVLSAIAFQIWLPTVMSTLVFLAVYLGADAVSSFVNWIPPFFRNGMSVASGIMPAVGITLLLNMLWTNKMAIYFVFGFAMPLYLNLNMTAMVVVAAFITIVQVHGMMDLKAVKNSIAAIGAGKEDDLFGD